MTPETKVKNLILKRLNDLSKTHPLFYERRQAGGFSYKKGIPDIYFVYDGMHVEVEIKAPGGQLSTMQEKFRELCDRCNIIYACVDSIEDFEEFINALIKIS